MARRRKNKSAEVRRVLEQMGGKEAVAKDVVERLATEGIKVSPQMVYTIKARVYGAAAGNGRRGRRGRRRAMAAAGAGLSAADVHTIKELVAKAGRDEVQRVADAF